MKKTKGFSLIEVMIVVAIIAVISSMGVLSYTNATKKARDARRKEDLKAIQLALELYKQDNGKYPQAGSCAYGAPNGCYVYSTDGSNWIPGLIPGYIKELPKDPINKRISTGPWYNGNYNYAYGNVTTEGDDYDLVALLENKKDPDRCELQRYKFTQVQGGLDWCGPSQPTYSLYLYKAPVAQ